MMNFLAFIKSFFDALKSVWDCIAKHNEGKAKRDEKNKTDSATDGKKSETEKKATRRRLRVVIRRHGEVEEVEVTEE